MHCKPGTWMRKLTMVVVIMALCSAGAQAESDMEQAPADAWQQPERYRKRVGFVMSVFRLTAHRTSLRTRYGGTTTVVLTM